MRLENRKQSRRGSFALKTEGHDGSILAGFRSQGIDALPIALMLSHAFSGTEDELGLTAEERDNDIIAAQGFNRIYHYDKQFHPKDDDE